MQVNILKGDFIIFKAVVLAQACFFLSLLIYLFIIFLRKARKKNELLIFELIRQAKLLLSIWLLSFFIYSVIFFIPIEKINLLINKFNFAAREGIFSFLYGIIFYFILSFFYLTIYYFIDRSISATILEIIDKAPQGRLSLNELKKIYSVEQKYQSELSGMLEGGFIIKEKDYYKNSFKGKIYARIVKIIKGILKLEAGG